jgi:hypothetical protein
MGKASVIQLVAGRAYQSTLEASLSDTMFIAFTVIAPTLNINSVLAIPRIRPRLPRIENLNRF